MGEGFLKAPENKFSRVNIFGEISSTEEFLEENLYIFYEFSLPIGWKVDDENEYYLIYKTENVIEENINKLKSISQVSQAEVDMFGAKENIYVHNFCLPYELELLCSDYIVDKFFPKLLVQINSIDSFNRHRIEGYCFVEVPHKTGFYQFQISCFKPKEENYLRVFSYFLGGSRKIPSLIDLTKTSTKDEKVINNIF